METGRNLPRHFLTRPRRAAVSASGFIAAGFIRRSFHKLRPAAALDRFEPFKTRSGLPLYINDKDKIVPDDRVFTRLSHRASLIACDVNETAMYSYACAWTDGVERWSVFHDPNQGIKHLEASGNLPAEMQPIRDQLFSQQDEDTDNHTDYVFDVPVEQFVALGGIRYDCDIPGAGPEPWEVLNRRSHRRLPADWRH